MSLSTVALLTRTHVLWVTSFCEIKRHLDAPEQVLSVALMSPGRLRVLNPSVPRVLSKCNTPGPLSQVGGPGCGAGRDFARVSSLSRSLGDDGCPGRKRGRGRRTLDLDAGRKSASVSSLALGWSLRATQASVSACHPGGWVSGPGVCPEGADGCNCLSMTTLPAAGARTPCLKGRPGGAPWRPRHSGPHR